MKLLHGFDDPAAYRGGYVAIGNFDGVHRGHQSMITSLVRRARADAVPAVVLTFDPHPINILRPGKAPPSLSTLRRKADLLRSSRVDCMIAYPTDTDLLNLTADQFFQQIVREELDAQGLVEGPNFFFGHNRAGSVDTLRRLCAASDMTLEVVAPVNVGDRLVSSSTIRSLISDGLLTDAIEMLGHSYRVTGTVTHGAARGQTIGYPTANLTDVETLLPRDGVYVGVAVVDGADYPAAVNLGANPTFDESLRKFEAHLIGFQGDLYGQELEVDFLDRIRDTIEFDSVDALKQQLARDVARVTQIVGSRAAH